MAVAYLEKAKENVDAAYKARDEIEDDKLREQIGPLFDAGNTESPLPEGNGLEKDSSTPAPSPSP